MCDQATNSDQVHSKDSGSPMNTVPARSDNHDKELDRALKDFTIEPKHAVLPCQYIQLLRNPSFSGREETIIDIANSLLGSTELPENISDGHDAEKTPVLRTYSLCGPGGIGKTSTAAEFVHRYGSTFDAVFWIAADEETKILDAFYEIALQLGIITYADNKDLTIVRETLLLWLANPLKSGSSSNMESKRASWLIVFDNVRSVDSLKSFWPEGASGSVLITCRDPAIQSSALVRNSGVIVPELSEEDGLTLLLRLTRREDDRNNPMASKVVQALGGYPLAIVQMSGYILSRQLSFEDFVKLYSHEKDRASTIGASGDQGDLASLRGYNQTLSTAWALDTLKKESRTLLEVMSLFDPDNIPDSLLDSNPAATGWDRYPQTPFEYSEARSDLISRSLIYVNEDQKTLRVHRLIQDSVRAHLDSTTFNAVYNKALNILIAQWPVSKGFGNVQTHWEQNAKLLTHALKLIKQKERFEPAVSDGCILKQMHFVLDAVLYVMACGQFAHSPMLLSFFKFLREAISEDTPRPALRIIDATLHQRRGMLGLHLDDREQTLLDLSQCVEEWNLLLDDQAKREDSVYGVSLNELGCAYMMNWDAKNGLLQFERSLTNLQSVTNLSFHDTTMAQINIGFAYNELGRYDEALKIFEAALKVRHAELGQNDYSSFVNGKLYLGWGNATAALGRLDESFELHTKCLEHYKRSVGNFHHRTGDGCVKAADHLSRLERTSEALLLLDQALKIFYLDTYHRPEAARAHYKKGRVLEKTSQSTIAKKELETALDIFNSIVPSEDRVQNIEELEEKNLDRWIMFWSR